MPRVDRVAIIGLGLIGGSLGMALKRRRLAKTVVGCSRKAATLRRAKQRRAIDIGTTSAASAVRGADIVLLATPVDTIVPQAKRLARYMKPGSILTDVGSIKAGIVAPLERALPKRIAFVGAHPLAGSERRGIEAADAHLFDGAICVITPTARTSRTALRRVEQLWRPLVGRLVRMSPREHDEVLAATSHLPHVVSSCLAGAVEPCSRECAAPSFLDMTRLAMSDPDLWDDIFLGNRRALLGAMGQFERQWRALRRLMQRNDRAGMRRMLTRIKRGRDALGKQHQAPSSKKPGQHLLSA